MSSLYALEVGSLLLTDKSNPAKKLNTLKSLIIVPVLLKKTYQNLLRYSLFLAVLLEVIQDFRLRYFYLSGTITKFWIEIFKNMNFKL